MQVDEIPMNSDIELNIKVNGHSLTFCSKIVLTKEDFVLISPIKVENQTVGFSEKFPINFVLKSDGKVYLWKDVRITLVKSNGNIYHKVTLNGAGYPFNRRESYRQYIGEYMPIYVNTPKGPTSLQVFIKDISETGIGFISNDEIDINRTIRLKLKDFNEYINLSGIVVRKELNEHINSYIYGCKFHEKHNKLGKYIAKRQAEQLRKSGFHSTAQKNHRKIPNL